SDDPAYFGGYLLENFVAIEQGLGLTHAELTALARNSFEASFLEPADKRRWLAALDAYAHGPKLCARVPQCPRSGRGRGGLERRTPPVVAVLRRIHAGLESAGSDHRVSGVIQDRWAGATGNVRPQADVHALLED